MKTQVTRNLSKKVEQCIIQMHLKHVNILKNARADLSPEKETHSWRKLD